MPISKPPGMPGARPSARTLPVTITDRFLRQAHDLVKQLLRQVILEGHALDKAR